MSCWLRKAVSKKNICEVTPNERGVGEIPDAVEATGVKKKEQRDRFRDAPTGGLVRKEGAGVRREGVGGGFPRAPRSLLSGHGRPARAPEGRAQQAASAEIRAAASVPAGASPSACSASAALQARAPSDGGIGLAARLGLLD